MTRRGDNDADGGDGVDEDAFDAATPVAAAAAATAVSVPTARTMRGLPTELFQAGTKGWGLRAAVDVGAGSFVGEYVGEVLRWPEAKQRAASYDECAQRARAEPPPPSAVRGGGRVVRRAARRAVVAAAVAAAAAAAAVDWTAAHERRSDTCT